MDKYILNVSHAVPSVLRLDFLQWIRQTADRIKNDGSFMEDYSLSEITQKTPEGEEMIILQVHFYPHTQPDEIEDIRHAFVSGAHEHFFQKVLAFGSVMRLI